MNKNKENAKAFYELMFNENDAEKAIALYVGEEYIQHNPHVADGKQGFIDYFKRMAKEYPGKKISFKKAIAEDDLVVLHCLQEWPGDHNYATIDIFKFDTQGKIIEHWDVIQLIPDTSANENSMF
jgi:predicted SnoaL-like aldol condensation-catalyzing enzyme